MTKTLDPMVLKVTKPVVVLPLVGVNRAFAKGPSICVAQPDSKTKAQEKISLFILRSQFKNPEFVTHDTNQVELRFNSHKHVMGTKSSATEHQSTADLASLQKI